MKQNINEVSHLFGKGDVDDGPKMFDVTLKSYERRINSIAKMQGLSVIDNMIGNKTITNFDPQEYNPITDVTQFPSGIDTGIIMSTLENTKSYKEWLKIIKLILQPSDLVMIDDLDANMSIGNNLIESYIENMSDKIFIDELYDKNSGIMYDDEQSLSMLSNVIKQKYDLVLTFNSNNGYKYKTLINDKSHKIIRKMFGEFPKNSDVYLCMNFNEERNEVQLLLVDENKKIVNNSRIIKFVQYKMRWTEDTNLS